jgi:hypothetical protein
VNKQIYDANTISFYFSLDGGRTISLGHATPKDLYGNRKERRTALARMRRENRKGKR